MKTLLLFMSFLSFAFAEPYTFLVKQYDKEVELEAKIISNIAHASTSNKIHLFIPEISQNEKEIYANFFTLVNNCNEANFVFVKKQLNIDAICQEKEKLFFTNNYQKLLSDSRYFGAFFWNKSRPNIVFIKQRLEDKHITLSSEYQQFIEDFN
jgi:hypothetical protein